MIRFPASARILPQLFVDASFPLNPGEVGLSAERLGKDPLPDDRRRGSPRGDVFVPKKRKHVLPAGRRWRAGRRSDEAIRGSGRAGIAPESIIFRMRCRIRTGRDMDRTCALCDVHDETTTRRLCPRAQARRCFSASVLVCQSTARGRCRVAGICAWGWRVRSAGPSAVMDEPTNHLDIEIIWLESFLKSLPGSLLMTSHDREFMNRIVTKIAEIDGGEITAYSGNYDFYERERAIRETNREAAYARQQAMLAKEQRFIERFSAHAAKAAQVQSRVKALDKIEKIELPEKRQIVKFDFRTPPRSGEQVAVLEGVTKKYGRRVVHDGLTLTIRRASAVA